jgi:hypothetical protein
MPVLCEDNQWGRRGAQRRQRRKDKHSRRHHQRGMTTMVAVTTIIRWAVTGDVVMTTREARIGG